jgi:hypothetical protein
LLICEPHFDRKFEKAVIRRGIYAAASQPIVADLSLSLSLSYKVVCQSMQITAVPTD